MKNTLKYLMLIVLMAFIGCEEAERPIYINDTVPPEDVSNVRVTPINGGFDIVYDLPTGKDALFVKAVYLNNKGEESEVKTSVFNNKLQILGFGDTSEKKVSLFTVDRAGNSSNGVSFTDTPLIPVVEDVAESIVLISAFGGIKVSWLNRAEVPVIIEIYGEYEQDKVGENKEIIDGRHAEDGELFLLKKIYTEASENKASIRNLKSIPQKFKIIIRDRYENKSGEIFPDTETQSLTPLEETKLDKSLFLKVILDNDDDWDAWGGRFERMFNDNYHRENWAHTYGTSPRPTILTIDLGVEATLSRFKIFQRGGTWGFRHANPRIFTVYGSLTIPGQDGNLEDWIKIKDCESTKPSKLPLGTLSNEDKAKVLEGDEFEFEKLVKIRYVRIAVHRTWAGGSATHLVELDFWGKF